MRVLSSRKHRVAAAVTAAVVVIGGGSAAVAATAPGSSRTATLSATTTPATTPAGTKSAHAKGRHHHGLLGRTDHATFELKVKGKWVTFTLDRGNVTAVSSSAISLKRPDGQSVTLQINSATHFGGVASSSAVRTGARASVISESGTARRVLQSTHAHATKHAATKSAATSTAA